MFVKSGTGLQFSNLSITPSFNRFGLKATIVKGINTKTKKANSIKNPLKAKHKNSWFSLLITKFKL
jgi:hypothetical protein